MDDVVIELSDPAEPAPPSPPRSRRSVVSVAAALVVVLALVAWLATRPALSSGPALSPESTSGAGPTAGGAEVPTTVVGAELAPGLSFGTLVIPTRPTRLVETGVRVGQRPIDGLLRPASGSYGAVELGGGRFLVTARLLNGASEAYLASPATGRASRLTTGFVSAVPGADGASVLVALSIFRGRQTVVRMDLGGEVVGDQFETPTGRNLIGESVAGLVYATVTGARQVTTGVEVVDATTGDVRYRSDGKPVAVGRDVLALESAGGLVVVDLRAQTPYASQRRVPFARDVIIGSAQFDLDHRYLAIDALDRTGAVRTVWLVELATGVWSQLPGTPVRTTEARMLWNSPSGVLAVTTGSRDTVLWRPGDPTAYAAPS